MGKNIYGYWLFGYPIYVGQAQDIWERHRGHLTGNQAIDRILRWVVQATGEVVEPIHLASTISDDHVDALEQLVIDQYDLGQNGLNMKRACSYVRSNGGQPIRPPKPLSKTAIKKIEAEYKRKVEWDALKAILAKHQKPIIPA